MLLDNMLLYVISSATFMNIAVASHTGLERHLSTRHKVLAGRAHQRQSIADPQLAERDSKPNVIFTGRGDGTYYYEKDANAGACGAAQPSTVTEYAERNGYPTCLGKVPTAMQKKLKDYGTNMIVALGNFDFKYCGNEVRVKGEDGEWHGGFFIWDKCEKCTNGLDFSSTELHDTFGAEACRHGRITIDFQILDNKLMDPLVDIGGTPLPEVVDAASVAAFGNTEACKQAELNQYKCAPDNTAFLWCIVDNTSNDPKTTGLTHWSKQPCPAGTVCKANFDGNTGTAACLAA